MPLLNFRIEADYKKLIELQSQVDILERRLKSFDASASASVRRATELQLQEARKQLRDFTDEAARAGATLETNLRKGAMGASAALNDFTNAVANPIAALSKLAGGAALGAFLNQAVKTRAEFQQMGAAIDTMLGSATRGKALMSELTQFAASSPLDFKGTVGAAQQMLGFGIKQKQILPFLRAIGDVSMGNAGKFRSLTLAFSQMSAAGKLMGQDLNQMINAGFNPLSTMAEKTGKSIGQLKEEMSKGKISAEMVQQAFIDATSEGGKFYKMSETANKTIGGQMSQLGDAIDLMFNDLGQKGEGAIIKVIQGAKWLVDNYEVLGTTILKVIGIFGIYKTSAMAADLAMKASTQEKTEAVMDGFKKEMEAFAELQQQKKLNRYDKDIRGAVSEGYMSEDTANQLQGSRDEVRKRKANAEAAVEEAESIRKKIAARREELAQQKKDADNNVIYTSFVAKDARDSADKAYADWIEKPTNKRTALAESTAAAATDADAAKEAAITKSNELAQTLKETDKSLEDAERNLEQAKLDLAAATSDLNTMLDAQGDKSAELAEMSDTAANGARKMANSSSGSADAAKNAAQETENLCEAVDGNSDALDTNTDAKEANAEATELRADALDAENDSTADSTDAIETETEATQSNTTASVANNAAGTAGAAVATKEAVAKRGEATAENLSTGAKIKNRLASLKNSAATQLNTVATHIYTGAVNMAKAAVDRLNAAWASNPIGLILTILSTVGAALWSLFTSTEEVSDETEKFGETALKTRDSVQSMYAVIAATDRQSKTHKDALEELIRTAKDYGLVLDEEGDKYQQLIDKKSQLIQLIMEEGRQRQIASQIESIMSSADEDVDDFEQRARDAVRNGRRGTATDHRNDYAHVIVDDLAANYEEIYQIGEQLDSIRDRHDPAANDTRRFYWNQIRAYLKRGANIYAAAQQEDVDIFANEDFINAAIATARKLVARDNRVQALTATMQQSQAVTSSIAGEEPVITPNMDATKLIQKLSENRLKVDDFNRRGISDGQEYSTASEILRDALSEFERQLNAANDATSIGNLRKAVQSQISTTDARSSEYERLQQMLRRIDSKDRSKHYQDPAKAYHENRKAAWEQEKRDFDQNERRENQEEERRIARMEDGLEKEIAQIEFNAEKRRQTIEKNVRTEAERLEKLELEAWKRRNPGRSDHEYYNRLSDEQLASKRAGYTEHARRNLGTATELGTIGINERKDIEKIRREYNAELLDFLKQYGTYVQKHAAIEESYRRQIALTNGNIAKRLTLEAQMRQELRDLNDEQFRKDIHWDVLFTELDNVSVQHLGTLKDNLAQALDTKDISIQMREEVIVKINEIDAQIRNRARGWKKIFSNGRLGEIIGQEAQRRELEAQAETARQKRSRTAEEKSSAETKLAASQSRLQIFLSSIGIDKKADELTSDKGNELQGAVAGLLNFDQSNASQIAQYQNSMTGLLADIANNEKLLAESTENANTADAEAAHIDAEVKNIKGVWDNMGAGNIIGLANQNVQSAVNLFDSLGLSDTSFGEGFQSFAEASQGIANAFNSVISLDIMGVGSNLIGALGSLGNALGKWGIGIFGLSDNTLAEDMERLAMSNEALRKSIDLLAEDLRDTAIYDVDKIYKEQRQYLEEAMANDQELMQRNAAVYNKGFLGIGGKHSSAHKINEDMGVHDWQRLTAIVGMSVTGAEDFFNLSSENMAKVAKNAPDLWAKIKDLADDGQGDAAQYMDSFIEYYKELEELDNQFKETLTDIDLDSVRDSFKSMLLDMTSDTATFAENFETLMQQAIINGLMADKYNEMIEQWYDAFADRMKDGVMTLAEQNQAKEEWDNIVNAALAEREQLKEAMGWNGSVSQQSSTRSLQGMSQDTAEAIEGRMTAIQIAVEANRSNTGLASVSLARLTDQSLGLMTELAAGTGSLCESIERQAARNLLELTAINENTAAMVALNRLMQSSLENIERYTKNI